MRPIRTLAAPLVLVAALAACTGGTGASGSPSAATSTAPSASAASPSASASASAAASPSASAAASPSASASAGAQVEVIATDYAFSDPGPITGPTTFSLRNDGAEVHELVIVRKNDGVTQTFEELLALPEDQALSQVQFLGQTMADPGQTAPTTLTADQPGEYLMVCFIPQGTMSIPSIAPDASGPPAGLGDGPPHFTLGMLREFEIAQ